MKNQRQLAPAVYTIAQVCQRLSISRRTLYRLWPAGEMPFLEEVQPRLGAMARFRADLVEQYAANVFNRKVS